jgi:hypothetical protein
LGYIPEKMSDNEFLINKKLLNKIKIFNENKNKDLCNSRNGEKNSIKRDILY